MKVNSVDSVRFEAKTPKTMISSEAKEKASKLLKMMDSETVHTENPAGTKCTSNTLISLSMGNTKFTDNHLFIEPARQKKIKDMAICTVEIGKNKLVISALDGEIIGYKKSFFKTWKTLLKQVEETLNIMFQNFNDKSVVTKNFLPVVRFTQKGIERYNRLTKGK